MVFFSFVALPDATAEDHRSYNHWHLFDHRPENLALPGVAWGDRWARPRKGRLHPQVPEFADVDYVAMYWFNEPFEESVRQWNDLGSDSFQWGRGPLIPGVRRPLLGFFRPVKGYAAAAAMVSADVLPYRPNQGLHLTLTRYSEPYGRATHEHHRWEDRVLLPALLDVEGVAGAWTFSFDHHQNVTMLPREAGDDPRGSLRIRLLYLDEDPFEVSQRIDTATASTAGELDSVAAASGQQLFATTLRTIVPFQDW
ncbi:hypothetical protein AB0H71_02465 [Nocardia sp. NPDC050697]|uniref:hypothetical protein n=1 Tax=Nocardia sp. NPDC050697 TaxID=3155158 RepID=UPI0033DCEAAA